MINYLSYLNKIDVNLRLDYLGENTECLEVQSTENLWIENPISLQKVK